MTDQSLHYRWLGQIPYDQAWDYQEELAEGVASGECPPTLLLLEHPPTYTFGRRGDRKNLLWNEAELEQRGIQVYWVDRGGDVTYHGPGQLVGYPILKLRHPLESGRPNDRRVKGGAADAEAAARIPQADFTGYLRNLESVLIQALERFGVAAGRVSGLTGVWVQPEAPSRWQDGSPAEVMQAAKIAAIGVKVDARGVTRHGFALNVNPAMQHWEGIIGCGLEGYRVTSLAEILEEAPTMDRVAAEVARSFGRVFQVAIFN
jgi:lipoate-protein ligase B